MAWTPLHRAVVYCVAVVASLSFGASAYGATAGVSSGKLVYTGTSGEDDLLVGYDGAGAGSWKITVDSSITAVTAQAGCSGGPDVFTCPAAGVTGGLLINLGDGHNSVGFDVAPFAPPVATAIEINGGSGADYAGDSLGDQVVHGGAGNDVIEAGPGVDVIDAGDGNDSVYDFGGTGADVVQLGAGADKMYATDGSMDGTDTYSGGSGRDRVDYHSRTVPVAVDFSGVSAAVTPEDAIDGFEDAVGSTTASNTLIGSDARNYLQGGLAADTIDGGPNDDEIQGLNSADDLEGGTGFDYVGDGDGNDHIDLRDGMPDFAAQCLFGTDEVLLDQQDSPSIASDCESAPVLATPFPAVVRGSTLESGDLDERTFSSTVYPTAQLPYQVSVETPPDDAGTAFVGISDTITSVPPSGVTFNGPQFDVSTQDVAAPVKVVFAVDPSISAANRWPGVPVITRGGAIPPSCPGPSSLPAGADACVVSIQEPVYYSPLLFTVLALNGAPWNLAWTPRPVTAADGGTPPPDRSPSSGTGTTSGGTVPQLPPTTSIAKAFGALKATAVKGGKVKVRAAIGRAGSNLVAVLLARGKPMGRTTLRRLGSGTAAFKVRLTPKGLKALRRRGRMKVVLRVTVTPPSGAAVTKKLQLTLVR